MKVLRTAEQAAVFPVGGGRFVLVVNRGEEGGVTAMVVRGCVVDGEVMVGSWKELKRPGEGCFEVTKVSESQMTLQVRKRSVYSCRERKEKWIVYYGVFLNRSILNAYCHIKQTNHREHSSEDTT